MRATFRNLLYTFNVAAFARARHDHAISVARWTVMLVPMAIAVGSLCAAFLWSLDVATRTRFAHPWLLFLLPLGGFVIGLLYHRMGKSVEGGNNLMFLPLDQLMGRAATGTGPLKGLSGGSSDGQTLIDEFKRNVSRNRERETRQ